jgi:hypothetical protein
MFESEFRAGNPLIGRAAAYVRQAIGPEAVTAVLEEGNKP